ncbi:unnamed protein product [Absidia cylindrospora]
MNRKRFLGTLVGNYRFCRKNFDDRGRLFESDLFLECFYQCACKRKTSKQGLLASQVTQATLALVFCIMLLKISIASGDETVTQFNDNKTSSYYKLYKELLSQHPTSKLARKVNWTESLALVKSYIAAKENQSIVQGHSTLNDLMIDSDDDVAPR